MPASLSRDAGSRPSEHGTEDREHRDGRHQDGRVDGGSVLQPEQEESLIGCDPQQSENGELQQVARVPHPPTTHRSLNRQQHQGCSQNPNGDQGACRENRQHQATRDGQTGKQELHHHEREVDEGPHGGCKIGRWS